MDEFEPQDCLSTMLETLTSSADSRGGWLCPEDEILTFSKNRARYLEKHTVAVFEQESKSIVKNQARRRQK